MKNPLLLAVLCIGIFLFVTFYSVSIILYRSRHQVKYHFYQMFPYEFNYPSVFKNNLYGNVLFMLASFSIVAFYILNPYDSVYKTVSIIISIIFTMVIICLLLMPLYYLKTHMVLSIVSMTLSLALTLLHFFYGYSTYIFFDDNAMKVLSIISMIYSAILVMTMLILIVNPRLTFKIYLDKDVDDSGNEILKRPRVIFLALNEWAAIFIYFLTPISVLLLNII